MPTPNNQSLTKCPINVTKIPRDIQTKLKLPIVGRKLDNIGISKLQNVSKHLVEMMLKLENITQDMEKALVNADAQKLEVYTNNLRQISQTLRKNLAIQVSQS